MKLGDCCSSSHQGSVVPPRLFHTCVKTAGGAGRPYVRDTQQPLYPKETVEVLNPSAGGKGMDGESQTEGKLSPDKMVGLKH